MEKNNFKTAKTFLQKMMYRKSSYLEEKPVPTSKKPIELRKSFKSLGLSSKEGNTSNIK